MTSTDYLPLLETIRTRITSWTARFLSIAGRLQLINSVLMSITNFWLSAFRLPRECIREVEKICSAFLWSGPDLNTRKTKIAWVDVCKPKTEGGLGIRSLTQVNRTCCLKLIWRITSSQPSLWIQWIKTYLTHKESFWSIKENSNLGSWIWRKLLKYRSLASLFHRVDLGNGEATSFWFDQWSDLGRLRNTIGPNGVIDMGIPLHATVAQAWTMRRRRRHRAENLRKVEEVLETKKQQSDPGAIDIPMWRGKHDRFRPHFQAKQTWYLLRDAGSRVPWYNGVWFRHSTPKYSLFTWLAIHNRLTTGDRMIRWNVGASSSCVFCGHTLESIPHLFFNCSYTKEIWSNLAHDLLHNRYTVDWDMIIPLLSDTTIQKETLFLFRYLFQATLHTIWRERNARRHGEAPTTASQLIRFLDKMVRNRSSTIQDDQGWTPLQTWFASRTT